MVPEQHRSSIGAQPGSFWELCSCEVEVIEKVHYDTGVRSILWWWKVWTLSDDDDSSIRRRMTMKEKKRERGHCVWRVAHVKEREAAAAAIFLCVCVFFSFHPTSFSSSFLFGPPLLFWWQVDDGSRPVYYTGKYNKIENEYRKEV